MDPVWQLTEKEYSRTTMVSLMLCHGSHKMPAYSNIFQSECLIYIAQNFILSNLFPYLFMSDQILKITLAWVPQAEKSKKKKLCMSN